MAKPRVVLQYHEIMPRK